MTVSQEEFESLKSAVANLRRQITDMEEQMNNHVGLDWGATDVHYPHPNQAITSLGFAGQFSDGSLQRLNEYGYQMRSADASGASFPGIFMGAEEIITTERPYSVAPRAYIQSYVTGATPARSIAMDVVAVSEEADYGQLEVSGDASGNLGTASLKARFHSASLTPTFKVEAGTATAAAYPLQAMLGLGTSTTLTISSGAISALGYSNVLVDTQSSAATDDLDTVNGGFVGAFLFMQANNTNRTVVVKHATGNLYLANSKDFSLDDTSKWIMFVFGVAGWCEIGRSTTTLDDYVVKSADETVSSNATVQDDNHLTYAVAANSTYVFECLLFGVSNATADFKYTFTGPTGAVGSFGDDIQAATTGYTLAAEDLVIISSANFAVHAYGGITTSGTAGNLLLRWSQSTSDAVNTTVYAGSYLKITKVA